MFSESFSGRDMVNVSGDGVSPLSRPERRGNDSSCRFSVGAFRFEVLVFCLDAIWKEVFRWHRSSRFLEEKFWIPEVIRLSRWCPSTGHFGMAVVPSDASTNEQKAVEIRNLESRYSGEGALQSVENIRSEIASAVRGMDANHQGDLDRNKIRLTDRTAKYNQLLRIEEVSGTAARAGAIRPLHVA